MQELSASDKPTRRDAPLKLGKLGAAAKEAVPALIKAMGDSDQQVRENVLTAFADLGPAASEAIPALIDAMGGGGGGGNRGGRFRRFDGKQQTIVHAAFALSRIGPEAIQPLIKALSLDDVSKRGGAAMALGDMGPAAHEAIPALIENLGNQDPEVQRTVAEALAQIGPETVKPLTEALGSNDAKSRQGAALALAGLGKAAKEAGPKLADVTEKETDAGARLAELGALSRVGVEASRSVPLLVEALKSGDEPSRHAAVNGLALVRPAQPAVQALQALLSDSDPALRQRAAHTLSRLGSQAAPATAALIACAKAAPDDTAFTEALAQVGEAALPPILKELSAPASKDARQDWIFRTLRDMGSSAMPALVAGLTSPTASVRAAAVRALGDIPIQSAATVKTISTLTADPEPEVRAAALRTLATVRTEREASASKLETALKDPAPQVRKAAAAGLVSLGAVGKISVPWLDRADGRSRPGDADGIHPRLRRTGRGRDDRRSVTC